MDSFHALIEGRVQGVGYRFFVLDHARRFGLAGSVRNLPDGRVEVFARGPRELLERMEDLLERGPAFGRVDRVEIHWGVPVAQGADFIIDF